MQAHCSSRNILWPPPKDARKKIHKCAFLGSEGFLLDGNVVTVGRASVTARKVPAKSSEATVAIVVRITFCFGEINCGLSRRGRLRRWRLSNDHNSPPPRLLVPTFSSTNRGTETSWLSTFTVDRGRPTQNGLRSARFVSNVGTSRPQPSNVTALVGRFRRRVVT